MVRRTIIGKGNTCPHFELLVQRILYLVTQVDGIFCGQFLLLNRLLSGVGRNITFIDQTMFLSVCA